MGRDGLMVDGRLRALARALLFLLLFGVFLFTAVLLLPRIEAPLPSGGGLPAAFILQFVLALAAALAAAWVLRGLVERRADGGFGFPLERRAAGELGGGVVAGLAAMALTVAVLAVAGVYRFVPEGGSIGGWLAVAVASLGAFAIPAAAEEAVFRGYLLESLTQAAGVIPAVLLTSLLFAFVHGGNPAIGGFAFVNIFLAGILLAVAVLRTGTLWLATGVHLGWNWAMAGPLDMPVSGIDAYDAPFYDVAPAAPAWLSGGAFGPEGGLAGTLAAGAALGLIMWITRPGAPLAPAAANGRG